MYMVYDNPYVISKGGIEVESAGEQISSWIDKIKETDFDGLIKLKRDFSNSILQTIRTEWMDKDRLSQTNQVHRQIYLRVIEWSIALLAKEDLVLPSIPFSFVLFGSGGRGEISFFSDQDHGIIFGTEYQVEPRVDWYFERLFMTITDNLHRLGYPLCEGNVLAINRRWRLSIGEWKKMIDSWFVDMNWDNIRYFTITADMSCLFGDERLVDSLRSYFMEKLKKYPSMTERLYENALGKKVPLGIFGQILTERYGDKVGAFSIKQGMYLPIVKWTRLSALIEGIPAPSTELRINGLIQKQIWSEKYGKETLELMLKVLTLRNGCPERFKVKIPDYVQTSIITKVEIIELKEMLRRVKELQSVTEQFVQRAIHEKRREKK